jgi:hypothetical protein
VPDVALALGFCIASVVSGRSPELSDFGFWAVVWVGSWLAFHGWIWEVIDAGRWSP